MKEELQVLICHGSTNTNVFHVPSNMRLIMINTPQEHSFDSASTFACLLNKCHGFNTLLYELLNHKDIMLNFGVYDADTLVNDIVISDVEGSCKYWNTGYFIDISPESHTDTTTPIDICKNISRSFQFNGYTLKANIDGIANIGASIRHDGQLSSLCAHVSTNVLKEGVFGNIIVWTCRKRISDDIMFYTGKPLIDYLYVQTWIHTKELNNNTFELQYTSSKVILELLHSHVLINVVCISTSDIWKLKELLFYITHKYNKAQIVYIQDLSRYRISDDIFKEYIKPYDMDVEEQYLPNMDQYDHYELHKIMLTQKRYKYNYGDSFRFKATSYTFKQ